MCSIKIKSKIYAVQCQCRVRRKSIDEEENRTIKQAVPQLNSNFGA